MYTLQSRFHSLKRLEDIMLMVAADGGGCGLRRKDETVLRLLLTAERADTGERFKSDQDGCDRKSCWNNEKSPSINPRDDSHRRQRMKTKEKKAKSTLLLAVSFEKKSVERALEKVCSDFRTVVHSLDLNS